MLMLNKKFSLSLSLSLQNVVVYYKKNNILLQNVIIYHNVLEFITECTNPIIISYHKM